MQNPSDLFERLPESLKNNIAGYLSIPELSHLTKTSKGNLRLFKSVVDVSELLQEVVQGNHEAVQLRLEKDISLIFGRGKVRDCSGRTFENISAFEYALWSLDKHMWTRMLKGIPLNKEGKKIFAKLLFQYDNLNVKGVTYQLNGKAVTEKHFDFENTIINALQTHLDLRNASIIDWMSIDKQWEAVGESQKLLPMHVIYEYCSREPFYPMPKFTRQPESSMQILNWATGKFEHWFAADSIASTHFAILKGWGGAECRAMLPSHWLGIGAITAESPKQDLDALKALYNVRIEDFINLKPQLSQIPFGLRNRVPTMGIVNRVRKMKEVIVTHCHLK